MNKGVAMTFSIGNGLYSGLSSIFFGGVGNDEDNNEQDVKTARDNLNKAGYESGDKSSGILDRDLDTATKSFQRDNGLKIDGIIRPNGETEKALNTIVKRKTGQSKEVKGKDNNFFPEMPQPLKLQSSIGDGRENKSEDINSVENALAGLGHLKIGEFNKDKGTIRPSLVKAIKAFQKDNGLFVDGVMKPDGETQEALSKETKAYFSIMPTKEEQERQERARKQREKPLIEQIADFLDPEGIEAREKAKEKYETPPFLPEREEGNDLEELARQGKIFSTIPPRDRDKMVKELGKIPEVDERFINKMSVKKKEEKGFLDGIGDAISGLFISEAEASELPEVSKETISFEGGTDLLPSKDTTLHPAIFNAHKEDIQDAINASTTINNGMDSTVTADSLPMIDKLAKEKVADKVFEKYRENLAPREGGIADRPAHEDKGGVTNQGMSQEYYELYKKKYPNREHVEKTTDLSDQQITDIYREEYFDRLQIDKLYEVAGEEITGSKLVEHVFDAGVLTNSSKVGAWLQQSIDETVGTDLTTVNKSGQKVYDGILGSQTREALKKAVKMGKAKDINELFTDKRIEHFKKQPDLSSNGGWIPRAEKLRDKRN